MRTRSRCSATASSASTDGRRGRAAWPARLAAAAARRRAAQGHPRSPRRGGPAGRAGAPPRREHRPQRGRRVRPVRAWHRAGRRPARADRQPPVGTVRRRAHATAAEHLHRRRREGRPIDVRRQAELRRGRGRRRRLAPVRRRRHRLLLQLPATLAAPERAPPPHALGQAGRDRRVRHLHLQGRGATRRDGVGRRRRSGSAAEGHLVRSERAQARYIVELVRIFEALGLDSASVYQFVTPDAPHRREHRYDLDVASYGVVKPIWATRDRPTPPGTGSPSRRSAHSRRSTDRQP